jgi:hypothetical protein
MGYGRAIAGYAAQQLLTSAESVGALRTGVCDGSGGNRHLKNTLTAAIAQNTTARSTAMR